MTNSPSGLKSVITEMVLDEAKKSKTKKEEKKDGTAMSAWGYYDASLDFSKALGPENLYKSQGAANWGPMTGVSDPIDDRPTGMGELEEAMVRSLVRNVVSECLSTESSEWDAVSEGNFKDPAGAGKPAEYAHGKSVAVIKIPDGKLELCAECLYRLARGDVYEDEENGNMEWSEVTDLSLDKKNGRCGLEVGSDEAE